jgi:energy-coupling factor transporter ATP-binding protein EcfA2
MVDCWIRDHRLAQGTVYHGVTGITIVLVEHKMKFISNLADRVVVLNFGIKIAEDTYDNIRSNGQGSTPIWERAEPPGRDPQNQNR